MKLDCRVILGEYQIGPSYNKINTNTVLTFGNALSKILSPIVDMETEKEHHCHYQIQITDIQMYMYASAT